MERSAVEAARIQFERAAQNIDELASAKHYAEVERHWAAFLVNAGRIFTKLEQGSKSTSKSRTWWGTKIHERRTDQLLSYIWHARNADEHGIQRVTELHLGSVKAVTPTPGEVDNFHKQMQKQPLPYAALGVFEIMNPHVKLVAVKDRGVQFDPPNSFQGNAINSPHPHNVGLLALSYLEGMIREAEQLIG